jgi:hypothetical protein
MYEGGDEEHNDLVENNVGLVGSDNEDEAASEEEGGSEDKDDREEYEREGHMVSSYMNEGVGGRMDRCSHGGVDATDMKGNIHVIEKNVAHSIHEVVQNGLYPVLTQI